MTHLALRVHPLTSSASSVRTPDGVCLHPTPSTVSAPRRSGPCCCPCQVGRLCVIVSPGFFAFETGSCSTAQAVLKLAIPLPLPPKCRNGGACTVIPGCVSPAVWPHLLTLLSKSTVTCTVLAGGGGAYRTPISRPAFKAPLPAPPPPVPAPPFPQEALTQALTWP